MQSVARPAPLSQYLGGLPFGLTGLDPISIEIEIGRMIFTNRREGEASKGLP